MATSPICGAWGCRCRGGLEYEYVTQEEPSLSHFRGSQVAFSLVFHRFPCFRRRFRLLLEPQDYASHPAVRALLRWRGEHIPVHAEEPGGYRTRGKMAVGPGRGGVAIGLFKRGTWKVLPLTTCVANHPSLLQALQKVKEAARGDVRRDLSSFLLLLSYS